MNAPKARLARYRELMGILSLALSLLPRSGGLSWIRSIREHPNFDVLLVIRLHAAVLHGGPEPRDRMCRHEP